MMDLRWMNDEVLKFIHKRFQDDCRWVTGNCYYFSLILKDRFPEGKIYYDVVLGHFVLFYNNNYYDWNGVYYADKSNLVPWDEFNKYDELQKKRIIHDCIM